MTSATDTYLLLRAFVDELARLGLAGACTSPGSRSTPLVLSLVRNGGRFPCWSHIDERVGAFFALGAAKLTGRPAALACTSGTAAAHYLPAVVEAHEARVPLIVLTADRPPELREVGAGQTIDQVKLYGDAVRWFFDVGTHAASPQRLAWIRTLACRAHGAATGDPPGPVHLNFPLREPLVLDQALPDDVSGAPGGRPRVQIRAPRPAPAPGELAVAGRRGVLVAGRQEHDGDLPAALAGAAGALGFPLLADPLSGARAGPAAIAHYDALLRDERFAAAHRPELVVRVGDLPTSRPLREWLAGLEAHQVTFDPGAWQDPAGVLDEVWRADPRAWLAHVAPDGAPVDGWLEAWTGADALAAAAIADTLGEELNEPRVAIELAGLQPDVTVFTASSMPVRDIETFWPARERSPRVLAHRGANGIDGTVAAAFGAAAAGGRVVLHIGDVALAHDVGALLCAARLGLAIAIVLVDNAGGGIFDFLPVAAQRDAFEEHVATPPGLEWERVAAAFGCEYRVAGAVGELRGALGAAVGAPVTTLVHVRTSRAENVALHRRVWEAVAVRLAR